MDRKEAIKILKQIQRLYGGLYAASELKETYNAFDMAIKSLSAEAEQGGDAEMSPQTIHMQQSPSDGADLISREEAIEEIENCIGLAWTEAEAEYNRGLEMALSIIEALSSASADRLSGEWKLASEELPQKVGGYIVTCQDEHGQVYVDYDFWTVAEEFKYNRDKVTAWIPFPKPYCGADMRKEKNK